MASTNDKSAQRGKLRVGDDWNATRTIALSQGNPLKAIAEFVDSAEVKSMLQYIALATGMLGTMARGFQWI
jgi:hypothetical protein